MLIIETNLKKTTNIPSGIPKEATHDHTEPSTVQNNNKKNKSSNNVCTPVHLETVFYSVVIGLMETPQRKVKLRAITPHPLLEEGV